MTKVNNVAGPKNVMKKIVVVDYDHTWPAVFETLRLRLLTGLDEAATDIAHVGSTAVPGLAAKPVIDLDVIVRTSSEVPHTISQLVALGYEHRGQLGIEGREAFRAPGSLPPHHMYLCVEGGLALTNHLAVRDCLRARPDLVAEYGALKKSLAAALPHDGDSYTAGKTLFLLRVLRQAGLSGEQIARIEQANRLPG